MPAPLRRRWPGSHDRAVRYDRGMTLDAVMAELESLGDEKVRKHNLKFGADKAQFGVKGTCQLRSQDFGLLSLLLLEIESSQEQYSDGS